MTDAGGAPQVKPGLRRQIPGELKVGVGSGLAGTGHSHCPVPANRPLCHWILLMLLVLPLRFARILIVRAGWGYVGEAAAEWAEGPAWLVELGFVDAVGVDRRVGCRRAAQILNRSHYAKSSKIQWRNPPDPRSDSSLDQNQFATQDSSPQVQAPASRTIRWHRTLT